MKLKKLDCNYFFKLYLAECTEKVFVDWVNKNTDLEYKITNADGKTYHYDNEIVIWINLTLKFGKKLTSIYHEVGHALINIFNDMDTPIDDCTSEIFLYSQEDLVMQIVKKEK